MDLTEYRVEPPAEGRPPEPPVRVALSPKSILVWVAVTAGAVLALMFVYLAMEAITWVLVAAFFAMALNPAVGALERRGVGRGRAAAIVFVVAFAALALLGFLVIPPLVTATTDFVEALPDYLRDLDAERGPLAFLEQRFHLGEQLVDIYERGGIAALLGLESPGASTARAAADTALALIAVPFLTFFMLLDGRRWVDGVLDVMPPSARPRWERAFDGINRTVGGYVTGNLLISLVAGTVAAITLTAAGVPYALPLAVIVAILDLIPLVGATVALVVCSIAALSEGVGQAVIVVVVLLVYQQLENHVLQPVVYGRTVDLSPLGVLVALLIGAEIAGVLGALAAIPVAGSISVVASELVRWRREASLHLPTAVQDELDATPLE
ncbi:MAG: AI-2E family transporter [Gaiellaceae bacterium]